jgi:hypothetical protein
MVQNERNDAGDFVPVGVWLATTKRLQARMLPGSASRDAFMKYILATATRPRQSFTNVKLGWPDWIEYATWSLSDGHVRLMVEVAPMVTLDQLYAAHVLGETKPAPLYDPKHQPTPDAPDLRGFGKRELTGGLGRK